MTSLLGVLDMNRPLLCPVNSLYFDPVAYLSILAELLLIPILHLL